MPVARGEALSWKRKIDIFLASPPTRSPRRRCHRLCFAAAETYPVWERNLVEIAAFGFGAAARTAFWEAAGESRQERRPDVSTQRVQHLGSQAIEPSKHQAIDVADGDPLGRSTPQHIELMAKDENFGLQRCARPEQPGHFASDQLEEITHRRDYQPIRR
jgi:hypothetical protein